MLYLLGLCLAGDQYKMLVFAHPFRMESSGNDGYLNAQSQLKYASNALLANHFINEVSFKNPTYCFVLCFLSLPTPYLSLSFFFHFSLHTVGHEFRWHVGFLWLWCSCCGVMFWKTATENSSLLALLSTPPSSFSLKRKLGCSKVWLSCILSCSLLWI